MPSVTDLAGSDFPKNAVPRALFALCFPFIASCADEPAARPPPPPDVAAGAELRCNNGRQDWGESGVDCGGPFCARCGQKASPLNPTFAEFLHVLFHELAHFDGKIVQSVRLLLTRPGFLSRATSKGAARATSRRFVCIWCSAFCISASQRSRQSPPCRSP